MSTGNPIADGQVQFDNYNGEGEKKEVRIPIDFSTLLTPEFSQSERLELAQNLRKKLIQEGFSKLDMKKAMTYQSLAGLINDFSKHEIDLMKIAADEKGAGAFAELANQVGSMLMSLPKNSELPGIDISASGKENDKELGNDFEPIEKVPGQTYIGVEKLATDDFIS